MYSPGVFRRPHQSYRYRRRRQMLVRKGAPTPAAGAGNLLGSLVGGTLLGNVIR